MSADQNIIDWIEGRLSEIQTAAGFNTDPVVHVEEQPRNRGELDEVHLYVLDEGDQTTASAKGKRTAELTVIVEAITPVRLSNARATLRAALADVRNAIGQPSQQDCVSGLPFTSIEIAGREIERREEGADVLAGQVTLTITYREKLGVTP